jgi:hypothetical protein
MNGTRHVLLLKCPHRSLKLWSMCETISIVQFLGSRRNLQFWFFNFFKKSILTWFWFLFLKGDFDYGFCYFHRNGMCEDIHNFISCNSCPCVKTFTISYRAIPIHVWRHSQFQYKSQTIESKATIMKSWYVMYPWQHTPIKSKMVKVYSMKREG